MRPEDFAGGEGPNQVPVTVEVVEYHGRETAAQVRTDGGHALHVKTGHRLAPGDRITLSAPVERVLVFAP